MFVLKKLLPLTVCVAVGVSLIAGCAPPKPKSNIAADGGRNIVKVEPHSPGAFETVEKDGVEYLQGRHPVGKPGGTFFDSSIGDGPKTFNGWASYDATSSQMADMLLSGLVTTDAYTGEVVPYMAKSVDIAEDKKTYTVTLRKGLQWSDGKPITADDVVFTWNEITAKGLGNPSSRDNNLVDGQFPEVRKLDELTIEFKTAKPFAPFLRNLGASIAPKHIFAPAIAKGGDKAFSDMWSTSAAANHPEIFVSSGMWLLERYSPSDQRVVFKRNPNFFMVDKKGSKLPYLDQYVITFVNDLNNQYLQFQQGKMDVYGVPGNYVAMARTIKSDFDFGLYDLGPGTGTTFLTFNLNTRKNASTGKPVVDPVKSAWFTNSNFRQAVDWALNREDMVTNILKGVGAPLHTAESLSSIFVNERLKAGHAQDIEKAKGFLKSAGFKWDAEGNLLDSKNNKVEFDLFTNAGNTQREATINNIQEDLKQLGIKVNPKAIDFNVLVGKLTAGDWEAVIMGLTGSPLEPNSGANVWKSDGGLHMFNQRDVKQGNVDLSDRFPWEIEIDNLMNQGVLTFDLKERQQIYNRLQQVVYDQDPFIYLYSPVMISAIQTRVQNTDPTPLGGVTHNLESLWVKE